MNALNDPRISTYLEWVKQTETPEIVEKFKEKLGQYDGNPDDLDLTQLLELAQIESGLPDYMYRAPNSENIHCNS